MMGVMTLALSVFSIVPFAICLANRIFMARVVHHLVEEYSNSGSSSSTSSNGGGVDSSLDTVAFWGTVNNALRNDGTELPSEDDRDVVWLAYAMLIFFIISLCLLGLYAICSVLLMYGAIKGRRWFMLPWIVCTFAFLLAYLAGMCLSLWLVGILVFSILLFFAALIEIVIALYLWMCVISLFQVLGTDDFRGQGWEMKPRFSTKYDGVPQNDD
jgi:hypothetical protein